jgi:hypothetical protein
MTQFKKGDRVRTIRLHVVLAKTLLISRRSVGTIERAAQAGFYFVHFDNGKKAIIHFSNLRHHEPRKQPSKKDVLVLQEEIQSVASGYFNLQRERNTLAAENAAYASNLAKCKELNIDLGERLQASESEAAKLALDNMLWRTAAALLAVALGVIGAVNWLG